MGRAAIKKDQQLNLRISAVDRAQLERAAELEGLPLSTLVLRAACQHAEQVLAEHSSMVAPSEEFDRLLAWLDEPVRELAPSLGQALDSLGAVVEQR